MFGAVEVYYRLLGNNDPVRYYKRAHALGMCGGLIGLVIVVVLIIQLYSSK